MALDERCEEAIRKTRIGGGEGKALAARAT